MMATAFLGYCIALDDLMPTTKITTTYSLSIFKAIKAKYFSTTIYKSIARVSNNPKWSESDPTQNTNSVGKNRVNKMIENNRPTKNEREICDLAEKFCNSRAEVDKARDEMVGEEKATSAKAISEVKQD